MGIYPISFIIHSLVNRPQKPQKISYIRNPVHISEKISLYEIPFRLGPAKNVPYSRKFHISEFLLTGIGCTLMCTKRRKFLALDTHPPAWWWSPRRQRGRGRRRSPQRSSHRRARLLPPKVQLPTSTEPH